ncbi:MAG: 3-oxoacyl-[acyl-carrier-protein] reductase [Eubacteriales bacterium]
MSKCAIVTGGSRGIGRAIALELAREGYDIALNFASSREKAEAVQQEIAALGVRCELFPCDVSDFEACAEMVKAVKAEFGSIDVLVNNAGITKDGLLVRMTEEQFDQVIQVDLKSVFNMTRQVAAVMVRQRSGRIVNITSIAGLDGNAGQFNYSAAKAGLVGMTRTAAKELGARGITVNAVAPGFIETDMTQVLGEEYKAKAMENIPLKRMGQAQDVAQAVAFLASEKASYITGQVIRVDGGLTM